MSKDFRPFVPPLNGTPEDWFREAWESIIGDDWPARVSRKILREAAAGKPELEAIIEEGW